MKEEKDFDNAVKAKLESRVYTPDENSWAAAERLITAQESTRRSGFGKYFLGLFVACSALAVTGWFLLYSPEGSGSNNKSAAVAASQVDTQNKTASADSFTNTTAASPAAAGNSTRPNGQSNAPQNMNNPSEPVRTAATGSDADPGNYTAASEPGKTGTGNKAGVANRGGKKTTADVTANRGNKNAGSAGNTAGSKGGSQQTSAGTIASGTTKTDSGSASANNGSETIVVQDVNTNGTLKNKTNAASENGTGNSNGEVTASTADKKDSAAETIAAIPFIAVTTQETNDQQSLTGTVQTGNNSTSTSKEDPTAAYWFVRGGLAYMPGFESTTTVGRSINPVLGGGYSYSLTKRLRIEAGLQYTTIGKASDSSRIYTSQNFGFGLEQERTEIGLQRLHYVAMPIQLRIAFGSKNALLAGVTPHYLFTAESRVRTYTLSHSTITNDKTTRAFGYNQGLRQTDLLLNAGYARSISDKLDVAAVFNFGLTDIKDNAYFRFEKTERHKNLQLLLLYKF